MSKYSHFEMCEKIFGDRYKWDEHKQEYTLFARSDMWDKLVEQQQQMAELKAENERLLEHKEIIDKTNQLFADKCKKYEQQLKDKDDELNRYAELFGMKDKDFYVIETAEYEKMKSGAKEIIKQAIKNNTKQVCEKIRKEIVYYPVSQLTEAGKIKANVWGISMKDIEKILCQIENENV